MRLLVTRPREDAAETVSALEALGHVAMVEPLLQIRSLPVDLPDLEGIQALLITSRNGLRAFVAASAERRLPVYAVGPATAEAARAAGFPEVHDADGDALALAALVRARLDPAAGALLHPSGREVAEGLVEELEPAGFTLHRVVLYAAEPAPEFSPDGRAALEQGTLDGVLFFSPRTGATFADLIERAGLRQACTGLTAYCLSPAVAQALDSLPWQAIHTAEGPNQAALLALLDPRLQNAEGDVMSEGRDENDGGRAEATANAAERVIARFGGIRPMAAKLGVAVSTVQGWKVRGHIPAARREQIERAAEELGLELEATDLDDAEVAEASDASGEQAARETPAEAAASEDGTATAGTSLETEKSGETPWRSVGASDAANEPPAASSATAEEGGRQSPVPAMLLGGVLVAAGAVVAILLSDLWMPSQEPPPAAAVEALERRMARLEEQRLEGSPDGARELEQLRSRLEEIDGRLALVAEEAGAEPAELESLRTVSERLSERLEAVESSVGEGEGDERLQALEGRLEELGGRIEQVAQAPAQADETTLARLEGLEGRIDGAAGRIEALEARLRDALAEVEAARVRVGEETVLALAAGQLREAFRTGQPYAEELEGLRRLAGGDEALADVLARLEPQAQQGVPTLTELQASYTEAASAAVTADRAGSAESDWQAAIWNRVSDLVAVRAVGEPEGEGTEAIVARAERRLQGGDLEAALRELDALEGPAAEAMAPWRERAQARIEAEQALSALGHAALDRLGGGEG